MKANKNIKQVPFFYTKIIKHVIKNKLHLILFLHVRLVAAKNRVKIKTALNRIKSYKKYKNILF